MACLILQFTVFAQNKLIDSLFTRLHLVTSDTSKINQLNLISRELVINGFFLKADSLTREALQLSEKLDFKFGRFNSIMNGGVTFWYQGNYVKALNNYFEALKVAEEMQNNLFISRSLANIGLVYFSQKDYTKALDYDSRALKLKQQIGDKKAVAILINNIGQIYFEKGEFNNALLNYDKSLKLEEALENNQGLIALNYSNVGNVYRAIGNDVQTFEYYYKALEIAKKINDKVLFCTVSCNIGSVLIKQKNYSEAETYLQNALRISSEIGDLNNKKSLFLNLSRLYAETNKWDLSLINYKNFVSTKDLIYNEENTKQAVRLEMNYGFEKAETEAKAIQERKDIIAKEEKEKQTIIRNSFIGGFLFFLVLAVFIYKGYINKQKANLIITKQKEEVELAKSIIEHQKREVEEKQKEILDSIHYAKRIQTALITNEKYIEKSLNKLIN